MRPIKSRITYRNIHHRNTPENNREYQSHKSSFDQFARICNDYLWRVNFTYPKIQKTSRYCSVIVENRLVQNLEFTIRNTISKLPDNWCHVIMCSDINYAQVKNIAASISPDVRVLNNLPDKFSRNDYNNLLLSEGFYDNFVGSAYLFVYQTDTFIFPHLFPQEVLNYDFAGAPWGWGDNEKEIRKIYGIEGVLVGNGGLSFRSIPFCLECLNSESNKRYLNKPLYGDYLDKMQEDVFFGICSKLKGNECPHETAYKFSHEPSGKSKTWLRIDECSYASHKIYDYFNNRYDLQQYLDYHYLPHIVKNVTVIGNEDIDFPKNQTSRELFLIVSEYKTFQKDIYYRYFLEYVRQLIGQINPIEFNRYSKIEICPNNPYFKIEVYEKKANQQRAVKTIGFREIGAFRYNSYIFAKTDNQTDCVLNRIENKYCINLPTRKDRKYLVQQEFKKIGLKDMNFFSAVRPALEAKNENGMTVGAMGTFLSHFSLLEKAYKNGFTDLLIIEDDCEFVNGFNVLINELWQNLPEEWDMIWIGGNERNKQKARALEHYQIIPGDYYGSHCILFSKSGIEKVYKTISVLGVKDQIDIFYSRYIPDFKQYAFSVPLSTQNWTVGDIINHLYHDSMNYSYFTKANQYYS